LKSTRQKLSATSSSDYALAEARKSIFAQGNNVEWGTPVLYMRSPDGRKRIVNINGQATRILQHSQHLKS
jgi:hypothetical protein